MTRRVPLLPTLLVIAAAAIMVALGAWQLRRASLHAQQLSAFEAASRLPPIAFATAPLHNSDLPLFRYATGNCLRAVSYRTAAGENRSEEPGYLIIADCSTGAEGKGMSVEVGWSKNPAAKPQWTGGLVSGMIVPDNVSGMRLVAANPARGLEASAVPTPSVKVTPARNRGYAATWFALAAAALVIYGLAVRKRWTSKVAPQ